MPMMNMSQRGTLILDPELKIRAIDKEVDPVKDADKVATVLANLKAQK
jgi:thioredoxin-dependent peroxiredoxin